MVLYTLWNGKKFFDRQLINDFSSSRNGEAISKLQFVRPEMLFDSRGRTLLHYAVAAKNPQIVQYLIARGCAVDGGDDVGTTPLILAMRVTHIPTIKVLLDANADIFVQDQRQRNALHMAFTFEGYMSVNIATMFFDVLKKRCSGNQKMLARILIDMRCTLSSAMLLKDAAVTRYMLKNGCSVHERNSDNLTALHLAVQSVDLANVKLLVEHGADVNAKDFHLQRPLHYYNFESTSKLKTEMLRFFLKHGACPMASDSGGYTVASGIFRCGRVEDVKILLERDINLSIRNGDGSTLLHHAARNKNFGVIQLFEGKEFDVNARDRHGDTALWYAAEAANWSTLGFLLKNGVDLSIKDSDGRVDLHKCFWVWSEMENEAKDCLKCIELFLQYTINCKFLYDNQEIILDTLLQSNNFELVKPLLAHIAVRGPTETFLAIIDSHENCQRYFDECEQKIKEMKGIVIYQSVTLFKFLNEDANQLSLYARNRETVARLKEVLMKENASDLYLVRVLRKRITRAIRTATLRNKSAGCLSRIEGLNGNRDVIDRIILLLDNNTLHKICQVV